MSFNPAVYNEGGLFRQSDFVGYLPEFLRNEPDVVTLMQVMSDYINNAYRNLDTTSEFELMRVCSETSRPKVERMMGLLREAFEIASSRSERVMLLSSPRNNVKDDRVLGARGGEYAVSIEYRGTRADRIGNASSTMLGTGISDGQVVYVKFLDGKTVPYYYDKVSDTLIVEPMGSSQDPFNGTTNELDTVIEFAIDEIGNVGVRYGDEVAGVPYYEVFFSMHISNIRHVPAVDNINIDGSDVVVDYCGLRNATRDHLHTSIGFAGVDEFKWKSGYPTGVFYLRDTSGSKLVNVGGNDVSLPADPATGGKVDRYGITGIEVVGGLVRVHVASFPGLCDNTDWYIVDHSTGEIMSYLKMDLSVTEIRHFDGGDLFVELVPVDGTDCRQLLDYVGSLDLVTVQLYRSRQVLDYAGAKRILKWRAQVPAIDSQEISGNAIRMQSAVVSDNPVLVENFVPSVENCAGNKFYLDTMVFRGSAFLACDNGMWKGAVRVTVKTAGSKYEYSLDGVAIDSEAFGVSGNIYLVTAGMGVVDDIENDLLRGYWETRYNVGDWIMLTGDEGNRVIAMVNEAGDGVMRISGGLDAGGQYMMSSIRLTDWVVNGFDEMRYVGDVVAGIARWNNGAGVIAAEWMLGHDIASGTTALFEMAPSARMAVPGSYSKGDFVVYGDTVYEVTKNTVLNEGDVPGTSDGFAVDSLRNYSVGLKTSNNWFMPYDGQYAVLDFGEKPDYGDNMDRTIAPLYICKVNDIRLRLGWKERQHMFYRGELDIARDARNGFAEFYSTHDYRDIVNHDLLDDAAGYIGYPVVHSGTERYMSVPMVGDVIGTRNADGTWTVSVRSLNHGLVDGAFVKVSGVVCPGTGHSGKSYGDLVFNRDRVAISVENPDMFTYVTAYSDVTDSTERIDAAALVGNVSGAECIYCRDYAYGIVGIDKKSDGNIWITSSLPIGKYTAVGTTVYLNGVEAIVPGSQTVRILDGDYAVVYADGCTIAVGDAEGIDVGSFEIISRMPMVDVVAHSGDLVFDGETLYRITDGLWETVDRTGIPVPFALFSRQNLFDVSGTNPAIGVGDSVEIAGITHDIGTGTAVVNVDGVIDGLVAGLSRVRIENVYPSQYNGWHMVTAVNGPSNITISMPSMDEQLPAGVNSTNRRMELRPGMWYKYNVEKVEWDKISGYATYSAANHVSRFEAVSSGYRVVTSNAHGLNAGDSVVFDVDGDGCCKLDSSNVSGSAFVTGRVTGVTTENTFTVVIGDGMPGLVTEGVTTVFRGHLLHESVPALSGEYRNGSVYFRDGDIVLATAQEISGENGAWRVVHGGPWMPVRQKRVLKIREVTVDMYPNAGYDVVAEDADVAEYVYRRFSDTELSSDGVYFISDDGYARNYSFDQVALDGIDTTRSMLYEYDSHADFGTVAPRDGMTDFEGIPDMKYPLVEKLERLAYLKDMNVIDFDLIGYLARYMGYDITSLMEDVSGSCIYRTDAERRKAVRETVENLPQYYSLGGTRAGVDMLLAAFGLVAQLLTKYTNTASPYSEMLSGAELEDRIRQDNENGVHTGSWVPTPHMELKLSMGGQYRNFMVDDRGVSRLKEQIRVAKPINVVFDDVVASVEQEFRTYATMTISEGTLGSSHLSVLTERDDAVLDTGICYDDRCSL